MVSTLPIRKLITLLLILSAITCSSIVSANECVSYISNKAVKIDGLKICESSYNGITDVYSCQDYQATNKQFRVLYKGGVSPKAIVEINEQSDEKLIWATIFNNQKLNCPLPPPRGIHIHAKHRGTGICMNEHDQYIPCSIYEHKAARRIESHRYMVFYPANDAETNEIKVDTYIFDASEDAMTAELAYQFGLSLLDTRCCSQQAMIYLEYAYHLYPKANQYSKAYNNAKFNLSVNKVQTNR